MKTIRPLYLVEVADLERERVATQRLVRPPFVLEPLLRTIDLDPLFSWYLLELRQDRLDESLRGDIDILAGRLNWRDPKRFQELAAEIRVGKEFWHPSQIELLAALMLADAKGIEWPPSIDGLTAVEVKCAYLSPRANKISLEHIKSKKSSNRKIKHLRGQIARLLNISFKNVILLDVLLNPPVGGQNGQAWLTSSGLARLTLEEMSPIWAERLPQDSAAGHWVLSLGAVAGGDESQRGAPVLQRWRPCGSEVFPPGNHHNTYREKIQSRLHSILQEFTVPTEFPVFLLDCRKCGEIHKLGISCGQSPYQFLKRSDGYSLD